MIPLCHDVVDFHPFQGLQASHAVLDTNSVFFRHDAFNGRHLENLHARLQIADMGL